MKKILLLVGVMTATLLSAKDIIVLKDASKIDAKIVEVSETEVRYKKATNLNGPTFVQNTSNINVIIYEDGETQAFDAQPTVQTVVKPAQKTVYVEQPVQKTVYVEQPATQQTIAAKPANGTKLQFNPQPSDNYVVGLTIGYVSKQLKETYNGKTDKYSFLAGKENKTTPAMRFGLTVNPTFKYGIGIRTGVFMEYACETEKYRDVKVSYNDIAISLPLQISYRYELIKKLSFMFYTGPVFDFGAFQNSSEYSSENWYAPKNYDDDKYHGFNCQWGIGAGIQWNRLRLDLGGEFGIKNRYGSDYEGDDKLTWNKPFYVTLTCLF